MAGVMFGATTFPPPLPSHGLESSYPLSVSFSGETVRSFLKFWSLASRIFLRFQNS